MLHLMILTILLLTMATMHAMRRVEEDIIKHYATYKPRPDNTD